MSAEHQGEVVGMPCPESGCDGTMRLRPSRYGLFYGCTRFPRCKASHGAHPDGRPLGVPATKAVKDARIRAHAAFDPLWQSMPAATKREGRHNRETMYRWLAEALGIPRDDCHMGTFDEATCERVVALVRARLAEGDDRG